MRHQGFDLGSIAFANCFAKIDAVSQQADACFAASFAAVRRPLMLLR
jgi:hypothetical protein